MVLIVENDKVTFSAAISHMLHWQLCMWIKCTSNKCHTDSVFFYLAKHFWKYPKKHKGDTANISHIWGPYLCRKPSTCKEWNTAWQTQLLLDCTAVIVFDACIILLVPVVITYMFAVTINWQSYPKINAACSQSESKSLTCLPSFIKQKLKYNFCA